MKANTKMVTEGRTRTIFAQIYPDGIVYIGRTWTRDRRIKQTKNKRPDQAPPASMLLQEGGDTGPETMHAWRMRARMEGYRVCQERITSGQRIEFIQRTPTGKAGERIAQLAKTLPWPTVGDTPTEVAPPKRAKRQRQRDAKAPELPLADREAPPADDAAEKKAPKSFASESWTQIFALIGSKEGETAMACVHADDRPYLDIIQGLRGSIHRIPFTRIEHAMRKMRREGRRLDIVILDPKNQPPATLVPDVRSWESAGQRAGYGIVGKSDFGEMNGFRTWPTPKRQRETTYEIAPAPTPDELAEEETKMPNVSQADTEAAWQEEADRLVTKSTTDVEVHEATRDPAAQPDEGATKSGTMEPDDDSDEVATDADVGDGERTEAHDTPETVPDPAEEGATNDSAPIDETIGVPPSAPVGDETGDETGHEGSASTTPSAPEPAAPPRAGGVARRPFDVGAHARAILDKAQEGMDETDDALLAAAMADLVRLRFGDGTDEGAMPSELADQVLDRIEQDDLGREMLLTVLRARTTEQMAGSLIERLAKADERERTAEEAHRKRARRLEQGMAAAIRALRGSLDRRD